MSEEVIKVRVMRMFPGCQKYIHCCDVNWNPKLENVKDVPKPEVICKMLHNAGIKKPEEFEKW